ncbi:putative aldehyde dehydrogenase [Artemisia annua]|uniref:Putative aldehyde dehydrogenase n=1 Tax=Artemisia annua TaxID=35608 RepID=A0A2U1PTE5_ARTAN|nr:putative aldehyde dehydrogenase [Artemisia annua]
MSFSQQLELVIPWQGPLEFMVAVITPFNFSLEIHLLQLTGALYMGNKHVLKVDSKLYVVNLICLAYLLFMSNVSKVDKGLLKVKPFD